MKVYELLEKEEIAVLRKEIDSFANEILQPYVNNLGNQFVNSEEKEIFDPVWGQLFLIVLFFKDCEGLNN